MSGSRGLTPDTRFDGGPNDASPIGGMSTNCRNADAHRGHDVVGVAHDVAGVQERLARDVRVASLWKGKSLAIELLVRVA